jgi:hypothetical protein
MPGKQKQQPAEDRLLLRLLQVSRKLTDVGLTVVLT